MLRSEQQHFRFAERPRVIDAVVFLTHLFYPFLTLKKAVLRMQDCLFV